MCYVELKDVGLKRVPKNLAKKGTQAAFHGCEGTPGGHQRGRVKNHLMASAQPVPEVAPVLLALALATGGVSVPPLLAEMLHALTFRTSPALSRVCLAATLLTIIAVLVATLNKRVPLAVCSFGHTSSTSETLGIVCRAADLVLVAT